MAFWKKRLLALLWTYFFTYTELVKAQQASGGCMESDPKLVTVKQGTMRGSTVTSSKGKPFCAFRSIPFAQPPVGQFRFQPPRSPVPWEGILDATVEHKRCIQYGSFSLSPDGQEDCLYLSVFTPRLNPLDGKLLDVLVWIFPGLFYVGDSSLNENGPHSFMDKDVIMVYFNHRLGAFGFFSTGDDEAPGNYGMKDQVAALQWVRDNIAAYGGNASSVTLIGMSSGSASVHYHMLSPLSEGLFHRAISMGGTAINPWARCPDPLGQAKRQARIVGCPTEPTSCLVACLREIDAEELSISIGLLFEYLCVSSSGYAPVAEYTTDRNPNPFLPDDPMVLMREGRFQRVPWIMGGTSQEGLVFNIAIDIIKKARDQINAKFDTRMQNLLLMGNSVSPDNLANITAEVISYYIGPVHEYSGGSPQKLGEIFSDRLLTHGQYKAVQLHALAGHTQIYKYNFAYRSMNAITNLFSLRNYGVSHTDEMRYMFRTHNVFPFPQNDMDEEVHELMLSLFTNFVKYGNPTPGNNTENYLVDQLEWLPIVDQGPYFEHLRYLNIGQVITSPDNEFLNQGLGPVKLNMGEDLYQERMDFWDSLSLSENCFPYCS